MFKVTKYDDIATPNTGVHCPCGWYGKLKNYEKHNCKKVKKK